MLSTCSMQMTRTYKYIKILHEWLSRAKLGDIGWYMTKSGSDLAFIIIGIVIEEYQVNVTVLISQEMAGTGFYIYFANRSGNLLE